MKKILIFLESLSGGGAEKVLTDIVSNLNHLKYDITVCTITDEGVYQKRVGETCKYRSLLKMKNYRAGGIKKLLFWLQMKFIYYFPSRWVYKCFFHDKYDIEIAFIEGFATKLISSSNNQSKKIAWVHIDMEKRPYADKIYRSHKEQVRVYHQFSKIVCVSKNVKDVFEKKFFYSNKIIVLYNPVDKDDIERKKVEKIELKRPKGLLLVTVGRLEYVKGYLRLLKCVTKLKEEGYNFSLWILGEGTQHDELAKYISQHNLSESVALLGFQRNPYKYINQCDAFVCSSYAEGFSTAATESLMLGKPIFTVNCAGMEELFGDYNCGIIVDNNDDALFGMLKKIVSGSVNLHSYDIDIEKRANIFNIGKCIYDIEMILDK